MKCFSAVSHAQGEHSVRFGESLVDLEGSERRRLGFRCNRARIHLERQPEHAIRVGEADMRERV